MRPEPKAHSQLGNLHGVFGWTRCSRYLHKDFLTTQDELVTCKHCRRWILQELCEKAQARMMR